MTTPTVRHSKSIGALATLLAFVSALWIAPARGDEAPAIDGSAAALASRINALKSDLANSPFKRPIVLSSREGSDVLAGDVYAIVDHPFAAASAALTTPSQWCDVSLRKARLTRPNG